MGNCKKAQELLDACPALAEKRKLGATKYLPTEIFILRKCKSDLPRLVNKAYEPLDVLAAVEFYKEKQRRRTGSEDNYAEAIKISTAEGELKKHLPPRSL